MSAPEGESTREELTDAVEEVRREEGDARDAADTGRGGGAGTSWAGESLKAAADRVREAQRAVRPRRFRKSRKRS